MDPKIDELLIQTKSKDNKIRLTALNRLLEITDHKVDWLDAVFDDLSSRLKSNNSYQRSIGMMLLCNLAKSDRSNCLEKALPHILLLFKDEKFITRRQCLQNIGKVGVYKKELLPGILESLITKFKECVLEDHHNLIRQDIISSLYFIYQNQPEASVSLSQIEDLIETESDGALKKKYGKILKK